MDLVYKDNFNEATTTHFAVNENNLLQYYYIKTNYPDSEITMRSSINECLNAVNNGKVGCTTLNGLRANEILKNRQFRNLSVQQLAQNDDRCFGVLIGNEGLLKLLNRGINVTGSDYALNRAHLYTDLLHVSSPLDTILDNFAVFGTIILLVVALIIAILVRDARRTRRQSEELANALAIAESASQAKTDFLNNMSHDIRTPMNAIVGFTSLAETHIADKLHLNQVLLNILSNAVKFTPAGGSISMRVSEKPAEQDGWARFEFRIKDDGIGMSDEFQESLFEPFTRARMSTVSEIRGTGLGMAITKSLVDMMGGSIIVHSAEGEGSEFVVDLQFEVCESSAATAAPEEAPYNFVGKRILLAEDNELNQQIALAILEEVGFDVDVANNGLEAVDMLQTAPVGYYDVVLMDIQMPVMDGYEATRRIRALDDEGKAAIPIIAVTANAFEEDRENVYGAGMNAHLPKPYEVPKMMATLSDILNE